MSGLDNLMKKFKKQYGDTSVFKGDEKAILDIETISSGSLALDAALLTGGLPKGRIVQVAGPESSGKTFLCMCAIVSAQKEGIQCVFVDGEHTFDAKWATGLGIDVTKLIVTRPDFIEDALQQIMEFAKTGEVGMIVWDSVPALPTKQEASKKMEDPIVGGHAKILTRALRLLTPIFDHSGCIGLFINQIREKIGVMFGSPETTPGGRALKHACSITLKVTRVGGSIIKDSLKRPIGHKIRVRVEKNKISTAQGITVEFLIRYVQGIDKVDEAVTVGIQTGAIKRVNKSTYSILGHEIRGKDNIAEYLDSDPTIFERLREKVIAAMKEGKVDDDSEDDESEEDIEETEEEDFLSMDEE